MDNVTTNPEVSVIVPARNEESCLADCLRSLVGQTGPVHEIIVVDDHSADATRAIAETFPVRLVAADPLPEGWSGKCNAVWSGARVAKGKWLLFTDADTRHTPRSIASGLEEAQALGAGLLSYSPKQEVRGFAERALMPVIFAELAATYRPRDVNDPNSPAAAANGQYLLIRRDVYDAVGGHAAVATTILEDVELARRVKRAGYKLQFRVSDALSTRMYRSFPQMWEGLTKKSCAVVPAASQAGVEPTSGVFRDRSLCRYRCAQMEGRRVNRCMDLPRARHLIFRILSGARSPGTLRLAFQCIGVLWTAAFRGSFC